MYHGSISSKVYIAHTRARIFFLRLEGTFRRICTLGVNFNDGIVERGAHTAHSTQHTHTSPIRIEFASFGYNHCQCQYQA